MKCPADGETLVMADRSGVEIDYCPKCRGVWLDRGELDKIIERSAADAAPTPATAPPTTAAQPAAYGYEPRGGHHDGGGKHGSGYRRKSWLQEIFD